MKFPARLLQAYAGVGLVPCKQANVHRKRQRKLWLEPPNDPEKCLPQQWGAPHPNAEGCLVRYAKPIANCIGVGGKILFIAIRH